MTWKIKIPDGELVVIEDGEKSAICNVIYNDQLIGRADLSYYQINKYERGEQIKIPDNKIE